MNYLAQYQIKFAGLSDGKHLFTFSIDDRFFQKTEGSEIERGNLTANVELEKRDTHLVLHFNIEGAIEVICDRCLDTFDHPIFWSEKMYVKFGESLEIPEEDIIYISPDDFEVDIAQHLYEFIILGLPIKRVHPDNEDGSSPCNSDMLDILLGPSQEDDIEDSNEDNNSEEEIDPRWAALRDLIEK